MMPLRAASARDVRSTSASPTSSDGVPPMRSRVQNEYPRSLFPSRAWVMSTQASRLFGEETDVETGRPVRTKIRHFDELSVAERSAILGAHYDRHGLSLLVALRAFPTGRPPGGGGSLFSHAITPVHSGFFDALPVIVLRRGTAL